MELASKYGISMIDCDGNKLKYMEDYAKCYMIFVKDHTLIPNIPRELMICESEAFAGMQMPIFNNEDDTIRLVNLSDKSPVVFVCSFDMEYEELYWRDITFDYHIIRNLFDV